jgi:hypothetical protein
MIGRNKNLPPHFCISWRALKHPNASRRKTEQAKFYWSMIQERVSAG